jgi:hypothetical protein
LEAYREEGASKLQWMGTTHTRPGRRAKTLTITSTVNSCGSGAAVCIITIMGLD